MKQPRRKIYIKDRLTAEERLNAAVRLEQPDRVPLSMMLYYYSPFHTGDKMSDFMKSPDAYMKVMRRVYRDIGPWDIYYNINPATRLLYSYVMMMRYLYPGDELPDNVMAQVEEFQYMQSEDYGHILKTGYFFSDINFRVRMLPRFCKDVEGSRSALIWARLALDILKQKRFWKRDHRFWTNQGLSIQMGYEAEMPFDTFSQGRTIVPFSIDLLKRKEEIRRAAQRLAPSFAEFSIWVARFMGVNRVQCYCHRTSNSFISPRQFEELAFPSMELIVCRLIDAGITPILHCDGDWLKNLKILRRLPPKKIILQLDGLTDIFLAKQEIGDHMCLFGDVPAEKLALGSPQEVDEYCHRLIEQIGKGGGFILAAGCEVPFNAKFDNLRAMTRSVYKYGYYPN
jgi:uroporphyrinogen-III decarboxylase